MRNAILTAILCVGAAAAMPAMGQSSSLYRASREQAAKVVPPGSATIAENTTWTVGGRVDAVPASTRTIQQASLYAVSADRPTPIRKNDLITIIVREQKKYEIQSKLDTEKKWDVNSTLTKWFHFYDQPHLMLGADKFQNGQPNIGYKWDDKRQNDSQSDREDKFTTRITAQIIDVMPNGNVNFEARKRETHDDEEIVLTLTGTCRAADILPDNTVLSTQVYDLNLREAHTGAVRDATRRGWIPRALDFLRPF